MEDSQSKNERASRGIYSNLARLNGSGASSEAQLESPDRFRSGFSIYSLSGDRMTAKGGFQWDRRNVGGVPLDCDRRTSMVYTDGSDSHTLLIGATGSKKSRLVAMPTVRILAAAGESMVICDPKAEIYKRTAAVLRQKDYYIGVVNLRNPSVGDSWNILSIPYRHFLAGEIDKACEFINDATLNLIPLQAKDPYWDYSSRDLLFGLILLLFQLCLDFKQPEAVVNISSVLRLRTDLFQSTDSDKIKRSTLWKYVEKHSAICSRLSGTVICPSGTMSCILSTFDQHMSCFTLQPQLVQMMSSNSLQVRDIGFRPSAIFLIMPDEKTTYHKLISIFIKQIYEFLIDLAYKKCEDNRYPVRINFLLDEFSSLPTITDFPQMITASRSRNIRFTLIVQSKHQLRQRYEEETETIQSNCGNWLFLYSRELSLLREISELAGSKKNIPLIPVSKLQHLNKEEGECLVFSGRLQPYLAHLADISQYDGDQYELLPIGQNYTPSEMALPPISKLFHEEDPNLRRRRAIDELLKPPKNATSQNVTPTTAPAGQDDGIEN